MQPTPSQDPNVPGKRQDARIFCDSSRERPTVEQSDVVHDGTPTPQEASPPVHIPGYTFPVHRHDCAVDIRDAEIGFLHSIHGKHILGLAAGAAVGSTIGAAAGSTLDLGGTVVGAVTGASIGGVALAAIGFLIATLFNPHDEEGFWSRQFRSRPYFDPALSFECDYQPAYEFGYEMRLQYRSQTFEQTEHELASLWASHRCKSLLDWPAARPVAKDAWDRFDALRAALDARPQSY